jgi:glycerophosphoryl diester phosphodiesterase
VIAYFDFFPLVIAHRGGSACAPENTMIAFTKTVQAGIKWVEFDVRLTADEKLIVFHDKTLNRTTNGHGYVADHPYAYLRTLDAGAWFHPIFSGEAIPSLKQVMEFLSTVSIAANIEIKSLPGREERTVVHTLADVSQYFPLSSSAVLFSSFSIKSLQYLRQYAPHSMLGLLLCEWRLDWWELVESLACISVHIPHEALTPERVLAIKAKEILLFCYTVNDPIRIQELYSWGVDAVFSDRLYSSHLPALLP